MRNLNIILGDQLDHESAIFDDFDPEQDTFWMAEVEEEQEHVRCHKLRIVYFLTCMRHFRDGLKEKELPVHYHELNEDRRRDRGKSFAGILKKDLAELQPERIRVVRPGDYRVREALEKRAADSGVEIEILPDRHFYLKLEDFNSWAKDRRSFLLETFYRWMRKRTGILMEKGGDPVGGEWNFDENNRETFGKKGPGRLSALPKFQPDETTKAVLELVRKRFSDHPGKLGDFDLPVTRKDAKKYLGDFISKRLADFGTYQDAMWTEEPFLNHSRLSLVINNKLLNPREAVDAAVKAYEQDTAPLNSVEGFVRQLLGWREFVRGIYWLRMPEYAGLNHLKAHDKLPPFYWDGKTDMECLRQSMAQVLEHGYAHHIQRLMVLGLFAQVYGADPHEFHEWHMAMYLDAIDWVSLPNTVGMSQFADGGVVGTKPYCASGNYINRMSNYCRHCPYDPKKATGEEACPVTVFYWDFLARHEEKFADNRRMLFQVRNLRRKDKKELGEIRDRAGELRAAWGGKEKAETA